MACTLTPARACRTTACIMQPCVRSRAPCGFATAYGIRQFATGHRFRLLVTKATDDPVAPLRGSTATEKVRHSQNGSIWLWRSKAAACAPSSRYILRRRTTCLVSRGACPASSSLARHGTCGGTRLAGPKPSSGPYSSPSGSASFSAGHQLETSSGRGRRQLASTPVVVERFSFPCTSQLRISSGGSAAGHIW